ncbi:MAG TPA: hypothetical protein VGL93_21860 [Streptosporangiaceae bacterium]|jgi:hypothetical protein
MMRARLAAAGAVLAGVLAATGCTSGDPDPSPSPTATPTAQRWQRGEFTTERDLCAALTPDVLNGLSLAPTATGTSCDLRDPDSDAPVHRTLSVRSVRYEPPPARPDHTATEEARHEFVRPPGWAYGRGSALPGYGDEAKIARTIGTFQWGRTVSVAVRVRNLVFQVEAETTTSEAAASGRVTPVGDLERGTLVVARALLARLGAPARPARTAAYGPGEVRKVHDVCRDVRDGARRVPGAPSPGDPSVGALSAGCSWTHGDDGLVVTVEAVPPGANGAAATSGAAELTRTWTGRDIEKVRHLGDEAAARRYDGGELRNVDLWARRGNLIVMVGYERWHGGPGVTAMRDDAAAIARSVFGAYR